MVDTRGPLRDLRQVACLACAVTTSNFITRAAVWAAISKARDNSNELPPFTTLEQSKNLCHPVSVALLGKWHDAWATLASPKRCASYRAHMPPAAWPRIPAPKPDYSRCLAPYGFNPRALGSLSGPL